MEAEIGAAEEEAAALAAEAAREEAEGVAVRQLLKAKRAEAASLWTAAAEAQEAVATALEEEETVTAQLHAARGERDRKAAAAAAAATAFQQRRGAMEAQLASYRYGDGSGERRLLAEAEEVEGHAAAVQEEVAAMQDAVRGIRAVEEEVKYAKQSVSIAEKSGVVGLRQYWGARLSEAQEEQRKARTRLQLVQREVANLKARHAAMQATVAQQREARDAAAARAAHMAAELQDRIRDLEAIRARADRVLVEAEVRGVPLPHHVVAVLSRRR